MQEATFSYSDCKGGAGRERGFSVTLNSDGTFVITTTYNGQEVRKTTTKDFGKVWECAKQLSWWFGIEFVEFTKFVSMLNSLSTANEKAVENV